MQTTSIAQKHTTVVAGLLVFVVFAAAFVAPFAAHADDDGDYANYSPSGGSFDYANYSPSAGSADYAYYSATTASDFANYSPVGSTQDFANYSPTTQDYANYSPASQDYANYSPSYDYANYSPMDYANYSPSYGTTDYATYSPVSTTPVYTSTGGYVATPVTYGSYNYGTPYYYGTYGYGSSYYGTSGYYGSTYYPTATYPKYGTTGTTNVNACNGTNNCNKTITQTTTQGSGSVIYGGSGYYTNTPASYPVIIGGPVAVGNNPYVTLSSLPYTGLDLGVWGTIAYWGFLILWCLFAAYLIVVKRIQNKFVTFLFGDASHAQVASETHTNAHNTHVHTSADHIVAHTSHSDLHRETKAVVDPIDPFILSQIELRTQA